MQTLSKGIAQERQHPAPKHDADPYEQGKARNDFGAPWRVIPRAQSLYLSRDPSDIEDENIQAGDCDKKHFDSEGRVVREHERRARKHDEAGDEVEEKSKPRPGNHPPAELSNRYPLAHPQHSQVKHPGHAEQERKAKEVNYLARGHNPPAIANSVGQGSRSEPFRKEIDIGHIGINSSPGSGTWAYIGH